MAHERTRVDTPEGSPPQRGRPRVHTFSSLEYRDYRLLWIGNIFNHMALWLQMLTLSWLVWELTESATLSGTAAGLRALPSLLIGPWAGVVADRMDRRRLVMIAQVFLTGGAIIFAFMVAAGVVEVWQVFLYAAISALFHAVVMPARQALMVNTVPHSSIGNAMALNAMTVTSMRVMGALLGGLLITTAGIKWNFFVEGGAYVIVGLLLIPMGTPFREESTARQSSVFTNLKDGFRYILRDNRIILHLMVLNIILTMVFMPIPNLLPAYTSEVLDRAADVGGYLMASQGVAGLTATFVIASVGFVIRKGMIGPIALVLGSAAILALAQSNWLLLSMAMMACLGFCQTNFIVTNMTLVQTMVPDTLRGRVSSIYMLEHGLGPLAIFLIGLLMDLYNVAGALTIISSVSLGLSLYFLIVFRQVRQLE